MITWMVPQWIRLWINSVLATWFAVIIPQFTWLTHPPQQCCWINKKRVRWIIWSHSGSSATPPIMSPKSEFKLLQSKHINVREAVHSGWTIAFYSRTKNAEWNLFCSSFLTVLVPCWQDDGFNFHWVCKIGRNVVLNKDNSIANGQADERDWCTLTGKVFEKLDLTARRHSDWSNLIS